MAAPHSRTFSAPACAPFHESRCRDRKRERQTETNAAAGVRERRTEHPRRERATKIRTVTAKVRNVPESRGNARDGTSKIIALLLPCPLLPVPGGNLSKLDAGSSKSVFGVPGAAVSFLITAAPRNAELVQNPVRKGRPVQGARTIENCSATITGTLLVRRPVL